MDKPAVAYTARDLPSLDTENNPGCCISHV